MSVWESHWREAQEPWCALSACYSRSGFFSGSFREPWPGLLWMVLLFIFVQNPFQQVPILLRLVMLIFLF